MIELSGAAQAAALCLADRLRVRALGARRPSARRLAAHRVGVGRLCRQSSPAAGTLLALFETTHRQDAGVPRARFHRRGADARLARHAAAVHVAGASEWIGSRLRHRASARRRPGADQLHAALPGPAATPCSTSSPCRPSCCRCRSPGRPMSRTRRISMSPPRSPWSSRRSIIPVALHRIIARLGIHRDVETVVGIGPTMLAGIALVALSMVVMLRVTPRRRSAGPRGSRLRPVGGAARPADDGHPAQRGQPGGRLHVAGERPDPRRDRRQGHAAGGRDQRRLLRADRLHRDRRLPVPHPRALRHRRRRRRSTDSGASADERASDRRPAILFAAAGRRRRCSRRCRAIALSARAQHRLRVR